MTIEHLALNILKNNKMSAEQIITHLSSAIDEEITPSQEYKDLYESAYGETITPDTLVDWVKCMAVTDGSDRENGQKWSVEQCTEIGNKLNVDWNKWSKYEWYAVMNMMYSDCYRTAKAFNLESDPMFYGRLAKDWLCDEDSGENKLYNYYFDVINS